MKIGDLCRIWRWKKQPFLGDIYKDQGKLESLFRFRESLVEDTIDRFRNLMNTRGVLISGQPGVGKTTFLRYLAQTAFPGPMKVISLAGRLGGAHPKGYVRVTDEQFLYIFVEVESFLYQILHDSQRQPAPRKSAIQDAFVSSKGKLPFEEYTRDLIIPLCNQIQSMPLLRQHILAIDDVDYLYPTDQARILAVICDVISVTSNPLILYSARPPAAGIARNHLSTYVSHHFGTPIDLEPLNVFSVIESRFHECSIDRAHSLGPFQEHKDELEKLFMPITNHNLRTALSFAEAAILGASEYARKPDYQYDRTTIIRCLYGPPSISPLDNRDIANNRLIQNLFRSVNPGDPLPFDYVTLLSLAHPRFIDEDYISAFNTLCRRINPKNVPQSGFSRKQIIGFVTTAHDHDLVCRIDRSPLLAPDDAKDWNDPENTVWLRQFCLSPKGELLLKMTEEDLYQDLSALDKWRAQVAETIKEIKIATETVEYSYYT